MMAPESGKVAAGVCHARGSNAKLPAQWLIYITVEDVDKSADSVYNWAVKFYLNQKIWQVMVDFV